MPMPIIYSLTPKGYKIARNPRAYNDSGTQVLQYLAKTHQASVDKLKELGADSITLSQLSRDKLIVRIE